MVADVVQRISPQHQSQRGLIQDLHVRCHLQISGTAKYICDVDSRHLSPCVQMQVCFYWQFTFVSIFTYCFGNCFGLEAAVLLAVR